VRIAGWILLVFGLALCLSVVWAPVGLLMMGVGLVSLQVAEQKRRKVRTVVAPANAVADKPIEKSAIPRPKQPRGFREPLPIPVAPSAPAAVARPASPDQYGYDKEQWRRLVESDPDLAQLASVLADYGHQYVDAFARNYLSAPNKNRIAGIVDGIIDHRKGAQPPFGANNRAIGARGAAGRSGSGAESHATAKRFRACAPGSACVDGGRRTNRGNPTVCGNSQPAARGNSRERARRKSRPLKRDRCSSAASTAARGSDDRAAQNRAGQTGSAT